MAIMSSMIGPALMVLTLIQLSVATPTRRECPIQFSMQRSIYRHCATTGNSQFNYPERITGSVLLASLENFCSSISGYATCIADIYSECQADLEDTVRTLSERSTWMCDENGQVRSVIANALNSSTDDSVPSDETNLYNCIASPVEMNCFQKTAAKFPPSFSVLQQNAMHMPVSQVFENHDFTRYFYELFDCAYKSAKERCPHNALAMALTEQSHFLFPPKFGINVSDIILQTVDQNND